MSEPMPEGKNVGLNALLGELHPQYAQAYSEATQGVDMAAFARQIVGEPKPALLPCPFCGEAAAWCTNHHVACANEACALGLSEFLCWPDQWNKRAQTQAEKLLRQAAKYVSTAPDLTQPGGDELRTEILDYFLPPNAQVNAPLRHEEK